MLRVSRYNHFQSGHNGHLIAYNACSGAVALMTDEHYAAYTRIAAALSNGTPPELTEEERQLLQQLSYGKFVYDDSQDELRAFKFLHRRSRFETQTLGMVIAPTMACNMACEYCFEGNKRGRMTPEVIDSLIAFVKEQAPRLKTIDVCWYGGEPLLAMDIIEQLTHEFMNIAAAHSIPYDASMISNGYLLTRTTADRLRSLNVRQVQVTLDGPSHIHNRKRPLKNGKESFATILENITYASGFMSISVRVNVDRMFTSQIVQQLLDELSRAGLQQRVAVNFGKIESATTACANIAEQCYENSDFAAVETEFYRLLLDNGFRIESLPTPSATVCMSQQVNSFLIDHEGYLYRCFNYVGDRDRSTGNIKDPIDYHNDNFQRLFAFDPFEDAKCRDCTILPICMGGCPARRAEGAATGDQLCDSWKHNLQPMLEIIARERQQRMQAAVEEQS